MGLFSQLKKMKILLIDDDEWIRDSMTLFFEEENCMILALETAEEALNILEENGYDIIIADYKLPGMNGLEFFRQIQGRCQSTIKIMISAYINRYVATMAENVGLHELIEKPFKMEDIERSLSNLLFFKQDQI